jgi:putative ABC transport system permease protein
MRIKQLLSLFRRRQFEEELDEEMRYHIERQVEESIARGMNADDARHAATRAFAGVDQCKEECRDTRGINLVENLIKDLRYALRRIGQNPVFTIAAVVTIALGIGVNTALFSVYNEIALRPLPVSDPDHVVRIERWFENGSRGDLQYQFSFGEYLSARSSNAFTGVVAASQLTPVIAESGKLQAQLVSADYFEVLGINAESGRTFRPEEDRLPGGNPVVVLSHAFWAKGFNADPTVIGKTLKANSTVFTVIGIVPEEFSGTSLTPIVPDVWAPMSMQAQLVPNRDWFNDPNNKEFSILGRLKPGTTRAAAQSEVGALIGHSPSATQERLKTIAITIERASLFGNVDDAEFRVAAIAVMLVVGLVLLVACANVANMMLAHGTGRQREIGIRRALGASRRRIVGQLLAESLVLALLGGGAGLLLSKLAIKLLWERVAVPFATPILDGQTLKLDFAPDVRVFGYVVLVSALTAMLFGLLPALQITRVNLAGTLKDEGGFFGRKMRRSRLRSIFIAAQVGISMLFLLTAGLLMRGLMRAQDGDVGFETRTMYRIKADFGRDPKKNAALQHRLIERLQTLPELKGVATGYIPHTGTWTLPLSVDGVTNHALASYASETYFDLLDIPILRGRGFTDAEARDGARVAVISESTARQFWPGRDPLSQRFRTALTIRGEVADFEVIGVAKDIRFANPTRIDPAHIYFPTEPSSPSVIMFRIQGDRDTALIAVRNAVESVDWNLIPSLELINFEQGPLAIQRFLARFFAFFVATLAMLSLALAASGIYGVMAYLVGQRTKEIGIRVALGASWHTILRNIFVEGMLPVFIGALLGFLGAFEVSWLFHKSIQSPDTSDFLHGVPFYDPIVFVGLSVFFVAVAAIASFVPARKALRVDPMIALRHE